MDWIKTMVDYRFVMRPLLSCLTAISIIASSFGQPALTSQAQSQSRQITISNPSVSTPQNAPQPRRNIGAFFDKLRARKPVTVAYLGGSVLAGAGASNPEKSSCRVLITEWLRDRFPKNEITEINAAVNGTGSLYGALRARRDVIAYKPDLVFIEFAINDAIDDETAVRKAIEGLLRQLLIVPQPPEVVMLYATNAKRNVRIDLHDPIAAHYQIPSIDLGEKIWPLIEAGKITAPSFWRDGTSPADAGHKIYAEMITAFLAEQEKMKTTPIARNLPSPLISDEMNYGEFKAMAEIKHDANWRHESSNDRTLPTTLLATDKAGAQIEYYFEGTVLGISYRTGPDCGMIEILIDGKPAPVPLARVDCYDTTQHISTQIIAGGLGLGEHKLTIRVLGEKNPKSSGNYVRLGYLLVGGTRPERL
jgi:acyl-CoA thioesterase I